MARSFSNVKILSALVSDGLSNALFRRGFAAASQGAAVNRGGSIMKKEEKAGSTWQVSWIPDPVTGYYRPENCADEIDVAELRATLLKQKIKKQMD